MPRSVKVSALLTFGLAILLFPSFELCKHAPALSLVNAFAEDPYDAVGVVWDTTGTVSLPACRAPRFPPVPI